VRCEPEERDYILDAVRGVFPAIALSVEHVVYSYSGIRPLPKSDHEFTGRISRGHFIRRIEGTVPQFCMVGGKWTTFRAFAEQTADIVLAELARSRLRGTLDLAIGGGTGFPNAAGGFAAALVARHRISAARAAYLADLYGTRADDVLAYCLGRDDDEPLDGVCLTTAAEILFLVHNEFVVGLEDVLVRRTPLSIRGDVSGAIVDRVAAIMAGALGWSEERKDREVGAFTNDLAEYHGVSRHMLEQRSKDRSSQCA
jgi:glycerol-3-phosphate dehydrogenase